MIQIQGEEFIDEPLHLGVHPMEVNPGGQVILQVLPYVRV
jgi:hypothetical protein